MPQYRIDAVTGPRQWTGTHGSFHDFDLQLSGEPEGVTLTQKPETPAPQYGETLDGEITVQNGRRKFKKAYAGQQSNGASGSPGGTSGGSRSPEEQRLILIQGRQNQAVALAVGALGGQPVGDRQALVNWVMQTAEALAAHCEDYVNKGQPPQPPMYTDPNRTDVPLTDDVPF